MILSEVSSIKTLVLEKAEETRKAFIIITKRYKDLDNLEARMDALELIQLMSDVATIKSAIANIEGRLHVIDIYLSNIGPGKSSDDKSLRYSPAQFPPAS